MMTANMRYSLVALLALATPTFALAQGSIIPPGDKEPVMRLEPGGPTSFVTALTFSPDGKRLYAAGFDKVVRVWTLNAKDRFELDPASYRVPIGPGIDGTINSIALSPDERWLAVAGQGIVRGTAGFRLPGLILPKTGSFTEAMWLDQGTIYIFDTQQRTVKPLRGHMGPVWSLAFAPAQQGKPALLVSTAREKNMKSDEYEGCARVWDVAAGKQVAVRKGLPDQDYTKPGLDAWHSGKGVKDLQVGLAWEDGKFHVWNVADDQLWNRPDGYSKTRHSNNTAAYIPGRKQILTATRRAGTTTKNPGASQFRLWEMRNDGPAVVKLDEVLFQTGQADNLLFPRALSLVSSKANGAFDMFAVVVAWMYKDGERYRQKTVLSLRDLSEDNLGALRGRVTLWSDPGKLPSLATAPNGRFLAVAGNRSNSIRIYSIPQMLKDRAAGQDTEPSQELRSAGGKFGFVAFVRKAKERGVLLSSTYRPNRGERPRDPGEKGDAVFNIDQHRFEDDVAGWKTDAPAKDGWNVTIVPGKPQGEGKEPTPARAEIRRQGRDPVTIELNPKENITDFAFMPAMAPLNVPMLAIAYEYLGQPKLELYEMNTGAMVRTFTGHSERIWSLAFSGDGRYLVSVADDQTVCVWSLAKLDKWVINKLGRLPGLAAKNLVVVDKAVPALKLQAYDVVEGVVREGAVEPFFSIEKLYQEQSAVKPGSTLTLSVRRPGGEPRNVPVPVNRGLVERTRCLLLGLHQDNALAVAGLANASQYFSPFDGLALRYAPSVAVSPNDKLVKGDVIESLTAGNAKPKPIRSARDFYETVALLKPGTKVTVNVRGKGNVPLVIGQGSDERKPLFSLFVNKTDKVADWEWVGWSPFGPYEASDRRAERHIGWHFNTGDPLRPASFALADQYRKEYYREGILNDLMMRGDLAAALTDWDRRHFEKPLAPPRLTMYVDEVGPNPDARNGQGQVIARESPLTIKLAIDDFPLDRIESVQWQLDDGPMKDFDRNTGRERATAVPLKRGAFRVRAVIKTYETPPREYAQELALKFVPPAPVLAPGTPRFEVVKAPAYTLKATATQGRADQDVVIKLEHRAGGKKVTEKDWVLAGKGDKPAALPLEAKVKLQPGHNFIEVVAVNRGAAADDKAQETTRLTWVIEHVAPEVKVPPPQIVLQQLMPVSGPTAGQPAVEVVPGRVVVVNDSPIRLVGQINCTDVLASATWAGKQPKPLTGFAAGKAAKFPIAQEIPLVPGQQTITVSAQAARSESAKMALIIEYRPRLPEVVMTAPASGAMLYDEGKGVSALEVVGTIRPRNPYAAKAELLVNNKARAITLKEGSMDWSARVPDIKQGTNRIQVRLTNEWGMAWTSDAVLVRVARPPHSIRFDEVADARKPLIDLMAQVQSPLPIIRESVQAEINGKELLTFELIPPVKLQQGVWGVKLTDVPLEADKKNVIKLWVSNPEARCRVPGVTTVAFKPMVAPPTPAEVRFLDPMNELNVTEPDLPVQFRVKSASGLKRVELVRESGRDVARKVFDLDGLKPDENGYYKFQFVTKLAPRENRLRAVAINAGGEQEAALVVNYLHMPVRLEVETLAPIGRPKQGIEPKKLPDGRLVFNEKAGQARVVLHGRVEWSKDNDEQLRKASIVRVYVNGFQQLPAQLKPPSGNGRQRRFEAEVLLNRSQDNVVEIELPDLKQDAGNRREFALACDKPEEGQRLHLLIVAVGEKNNQQLVDQALLSLRATRDKNKNEIKTPAFSQVRVYGPLTDFVTPQHVFTQLCLIKKTIDVLAAQGSPNDVVMVYYQGGEAVKNEGNVFETSLTKYDKELKRSGITLGGLQGFFDETLGAKLLWLDVAKVPSKDQRGTDQLAKMSPDTYFNVMRYRWADPNAGRAGGSLMNDWGKAMQKDQSGFLQSVTAEVADLYKNRKAAVTYDGFIPDGLEKLLVDRKSEP